MHMYNQYPSTPILFFEHSKSTVTNLKYNFPKRHSISATFNAFQVDLNSKIDQSYKTECYLNELY